MTLFAFVAADNGTAEVGLEAALSRREWCSIPSSPRGPSVALASGGEVLRIAARAFV